MVKREARSNTVLNQYLREARLYCFYELKQAGKGDIFRFNSIEKVQWDGLQATEKNGLVWKLSDETSRPKPCDGFSIPPLPSYLAIKFQDEFVLIRFEKIVRLKEAGVFSLIKDSAEEISDRIIQLK